MLLERYNKRSPTVGLSRSMQIERLWYYRGSTIYFGAIAGEIEASCSRMTTTEPFSSPCVYLSRSNQCAPIAPYKPVYITLQQFYLVYVFTLAAPAAPTVNRIKISDILGTQSYSDDPPPSHLLSHTSKSYTLLYSNLSP